MWVFLLPLVSILAMVVYDVFDSMFSPLAQWLDGAVLEIDEDSLSNYMDNSEYEWGHNIKGYQHEELNTKKQD